MKLKVGVFFGGKSVEHEISIITANQVIGAVDREKYDVVPIYISKKGLMYTGDFLFSLENYKDMNKLMENITQVSLVNDGKSVNVIKFPVNKFKNNILNTIDVAIPAVHGTNGEDGSIQGFFEMLNLPYTGSDILASSVGMDKIMMHRVLKENGINVLDNFSFYVTDYLDDKEKIIKKIENKIKYPVIVKAGNLGSSVGIKTAKNKKGLIDAINYVIKFTDRIMVEKLITNLKEINCSLIGDKEDVKTSILEEPIGKDEILSYNDKYIAGDKNKMGGNMANLDHIIPARVTKEEEKQIRKMATDTFLLLGASGVARIDFMIDKDSNDIYVNEINTIPGAFSYYLWEKTDISFKNEITMLIDLAFKKNREKNNTTFTYDNNILKYANFKNK